MALFAQQKNPAHLFILSLEFNHVRMHKKYYNFKSAYITPVAENKASETATIK